MATLITDPNAPPDPGAVRPIPDGQYPAGPPVINDDDTRFNPTMPGAPPSEDFPVGVPPGDPQQPPEQPPQAPIPPPDVIPPPVDPNAPHPDHTLPGDLPAEPPPEKAKHHEEPKKKK